MIRRIQSVSFSIGQLTFGSFVLLLALIAMTSIASVVAIRHIDATFAELQHLQSLGEAAEEIDRRTKELRLAARDFVTDPAAPSGRVREAASSLSTLLKNTRLKLAPDQQDMIDGVTQRLANYQDGLERISALISRREELVAALPPVRARFEQAISDIPDRTTARGLFRAQNRLAAALLAHDTAATEQSAQAMKSLSIDDAALRAATDAYADAVLSLANTEGEVAQLDREVLGTEGRGISRVTDLLRDLSDGRGRVLAGDFARTLARDKWQSILLGLAGVLIGLGAAAFVVRQTVRPLKAIATAIRSLASGEKDTSIPSTDVSNEIGDIARAAEVFRRSLVDADAAREAAIHALAEQRLAEAAIAEGRRLLQLVIDTVPAVINVKDKQLRYVLMNRYMAGIFAIEPNAAIGQTTSELLARFGAQKSDENDRRVLATGRELGFYEDEHRDWTGTLRHWLVNKLPLLDADGHVESIVTVALDIGERKRSEHEMRVAKDAAEAALRNLRETQNSLIEAEKLAALGRLVAGVAHEVNNPVGISLTVASSLERKTALFAAEVERGNLRRSNLTDFLGASRDASSQLVANLNRAAELIASFKQVAADRNYSDQRTFDLGDLTEQVVMSLRPGLRKHRLTLTVDCEPNLMVNSYPGPYGQVLTNLFLNSVAHAFPDGRAGTVDIKVRAAGPDHVEIVFADDGCGMSLDVRRRAFDPFFTTRRDQGGTGLGLHIVYSIVTSRLGGRLDLDSEPGQGTRVRMILPRVAPLEQAAE